MQQRRKPLSLAIQLGLLFAPGLALAQTPASPDPTTLHAVTVTGTRIKQAEIQGQVPIQTVTREYIERTGLTSIADVVQQLTGSGPADLPDVLAQRLRRIHLRHPRRPVLLRARRPAVLIDR